MHASDPPEHEACSLDTLEFQDSEKFQIHVLKFMVLDLNDTLKDSRVVFRVWVDFGLDGDISFSFVHVALNIDDFLKYTEDVALSVFYRVEIQMSFPEAKHIKKTLLFIEMLRLFFFCPELSLLEVTYNNRGKQLVHTLLVRDLRVSPAPDKQQEIEKLNDGLFLEEFHLLVGSLNILVNFLFEEFVGLLN